MMDFDTQKSATRLLDGSATQEDRDRVLYFLAATRWTPDKLDEHIRTVHHTLCQNCPDRKAAQAVQTAQPMHQPQPQRMDWNGIIKALIYAFAILGTAIVSLIKLIPN